MTDIHPGPFGLVSDAHGNPFGLQAALGLLRKRGARTIFFLGDAVGYLPLESEVIELLRGAGAICVCGNHEAMLLRNLPCNSDGVYRLTAARSRLGPGDLREIGSWPDRRAVADSRSPNCTLVLAHGSPSDPLQGYLYPDADMAFIDELDCVALGCGHTHRAFVSRRGEKLIVNCGSVGLPRDIGGSASCALLDLATLECEILRQPFDVDRLLDECGRVEPPHAEVVTALRRHFVADLVGNS